MQEYDKLNQPAYLRNIDGRLVRERWVEVWGYGGLRPCHWPCKSGKLAQTHYLIMKTREAIICILSSDKALSRNANVCMSDCLSVCLCLRQVWHFGAYKQNGGQQWLFIKKCPHVIQFKKENTLHTKHHILYYKRLCLSVCVSVTLPHVTW